MGTSLWILLLKLLDLFEALLDYFVQVSVMFTKADDGQWELVYLSSLPTAKGWDVLDAVVTIIHNGLDFVAQFVVLLPAADGVWNNSIVPRAYTAPIT
jgi:hypothetical protein